MDFPSVILVIGPEKTLFEISQDLICGQSVFFKTAFEGSFLEATTKVMEIPEGDADLFHTFFAYCRRGYKGFLEMSLNLEDQILAYIFADEYQCEGFMNCLMDKMQNTLLDFKSASGDHLDATLIKDVVDSNMGPGSGGFLSATLIEHIVDNTMGPQSARLQEFGAACIAFGVRNSDIGAEEVEGYLEEFIQVPEILKEYLELAQFPMTKQCSCRDDRVVLHDPRVRTQMGAFHLCYFHVHKKGEKCESEPNGPDHEDTEETCRVCTSFDFNNVVFLLDNPDA